MNATKLTAQEPEQENAKFSFSGILSMTSVLLSVQEFSSCTQEFYKDTDYCFSSCHAETPSSLFSWQICLAETALVILIKQAEPSNIKAAFGLLSDLMLASRLGGYASSAVPLRQQDLRDFLSLLLNPYAPCQELYSVWAWLSYSVWWIYQVLRPPKMFITLTATVISSSQLSLSLCAISSSKENWQRNSSFLQLEPGVNIMKPSILESLHFLRFFISLKP